MVRTRVTLKGISRFPLPQAGAAPRRAECTGLGGVAAPWAELVHVSAVPACLTAAFLTGQVAGVPASGRCGAFRALPFCGSGFLGDHGVRWRPGACGPSSLLDASPGPRDVWNSRNLREQPGVGARVG